jgi:hypothetical protein
VFFLTEDLVSSIKRRTLMPVSQQTFQDADIITVANERLQLSLQPRMMAVRENFFLRNQRVALTANLNHYSLPERAVGNALREVFYVDSNGKRQWPPIPQQKISSLADTTQTGPRPFFTDLVGDELWLVPCPSSSSGYVELWYYERCSKLVPVTSCAKITAVSSVGGTTTLTVNADLSASLPTGSLIDIQKGKSPFRLSSIDVSITGITSSTVAIATSAVSDEASNVLPAIGDYVVPAQAACIPMLPQELHPLLAQETAVTILEALGDIQKLAAAKQTLGEMTMSSFNLIKNRIENEAQHVFNRRGISSYTGSNFIPVPSRSS